MAVNSAWILRVRFVYNSRLLSVVYVVLLRQGMVLATVSYHRAHRFFVISVGLLL